MSPTNRWRRHAPQTLIDERHGMREKGGNSGSWRRAIRTRLFTFGQSSGPSSPTLENQSRADNKQISSACPAPNYLRLGKKKMWRHFHFHSHFHFTLDASASASASSVAHCTWVSSVAAARVESEIFEIAWSAWQRYFHSS